MSYNANQYNYATPLNSATSLVGETVAVSDKKYFSLFDNTLDGSYFPIEGDAGIWGSSLADANGILPTPFTLTVVESLTINAFRLTSSSRYYPVDFTVKFYNGNTLLHTIDQAGNSDSVYIHYLQRTLVVTSYVVSITKISAPGVAVIYNAYNLGYVKRADKADVYAQFASDASSVHDVLSVDALYLKGVDRQSSTEVHCAASDVSLVSSTHTSAYTINVSGADSLRGNLTNESTEVRNTLHDVSDKLSVKQVAASSIENTIDVTTDKLLTRTDEHVSHVINNIDRTFDICPVGVLANTTTDLVNIHSIMKQPTRHIYGKVYITYTDPMLASDTLIDSSGEAYNSNPLQLLDSNVSTDNKFFTLYDNDLTGDYVVSDDNSQVGWVSDKLSNADGTFDGDAPYIRVNFSERPIMNLQVVFDSQHGALAKDFHVDYLLADGSTVRYSITDNNEYTVTMNDIVAQVVAITITVTRVDKPGYPVVILEIPTLSTRLYTGYQDMSNLVSIDLLEELTYDDTIEALGGVSANEITVKLDNSTGEFLFNNAESAVASSLRRNRKIVPWLGVEVTPGDIEWYTLGTFWSYKWDVPVEGLVATVVGFDTIGLLDTTNFTNHTMQVNKSIGYLIEYVLNDAKQSLDFIEYNIDPALYDVIIPYAWFEARSHTAALRKLSMCYPMHVYCDRDGVICAAPQKLRLDYYYDTWSDSTNVISKSYSSLYTTLPNIINVEIKSPVVVTEDKMVDDALIFDVSLLPTRTLNFNSPYISDIRVDIQCDDTVEYTYDAYSWGIVVNFTGTGKVYNITCVGTTLDVTSSTTISKRDENSIRLNGAISRNITSDFIQTSDLAIELINRLVSLSAYDKYDVEVNYRGDVALTINDPILLLDGIAPDNRYNIKRHQLFWNGSLSGVAYLNT